MKKLEIGFNRIYVIESLDEGDPKTGSNLYHDLLQYQHYALQHMSAELIVINTLDEFKALQAKILHDISYSALLPYLHFEMHGCESGLVLSSDEIVDWTMLCEFLLPINEATRNNLFASFASCYGAYVFSIVDPTMPTPLFGYIGSPVEIYSQEIEASFNPYFETLLRAFDFNEAVNALNQFNPQGPHRFVCYSAEQIFDIVAEKHIVALNDPSYRQDRINNQLKIACLSPTLKDVPEADLRRVISAEFDILVETEMRNLKSKFLMEDLPLTILHEFIKRKE